MSILECKNIQKRYGSVVALSRADISLQAGEIRAVLGGNGSGKSTLAKILGGAVRPSQGEIFLNGQKTEFLSPSQSKRAGLVITSQELSLFGNQTVETNLVMCNIPKQYGIFTNRKAVREQALQQLDELKLSHLVGKYVSELAPNEQYMVEFAKAMIQKPKIVIVDEITSALYREEVELVKQSLFNLKEQGISTIFISHRMSEIYAMCDSVTIMRNGETIDTVSIHDKTSNELLSMMSGREVNDEKPVATLQTEQSGETLLSIPNISLSRFRTQFKLDVKLGEFIGVAGLQGHGQADLVRTLFGMQGPLDVTLENQPHSINSPRQAVMAGMAFVSGDREKEGVFAGRSLAENLGAVSSLVLGETNKPADEVLKSHGVKFSSSKQTIRTLSGGNQQKVVISRWVEARPKLLLADDPTKGIDVNARQDVHKTFCSLMTQGTSVIYVSSDDEELVQIARMAPASRIIIMYEGQIVRTLIGAEITTENIISASMPRGA